MQAVLGLHRGKLFDALWQLNELLKFSYITSCGTVSKLSAFKEFEQMSLMTNKIKLVFIILRTSNGLKNNILHRYRTCCAHIILRFLCITESYIELYFLTQSTYLEHIELRSTFSGNFVFNVKRSTTRSHVFGRVRLIITYFNAFSPSILKFDKVSEL